jgi:cytochrome c peroxidase
MRPTSPAWLSLRPWLVSALAAAAGACGGSAEGDTPEPADVAETEPDLPAGQDAGTVAPDAGPIGADAAGSTDAGATVDVSWPTDVERPPALVPYCRSLDPAWRARYAGDPTDAALAGEIAARRLEGDPRVRVEDGACVARGLPDISDPVAVLGRELFFSKDLSGDRDVACATCHHPLLGGGDALSVSVGPVPWDPSREDAMGADRVRGLTDASQLKVGRNANTTFNIAFWDDGLFWDSRVRALAPGPGLNGAGAPISTPDAPGATAADPASPENLTVAQARMPVIEEHEMAGSLAAQFPGDHEGLRAALAGRFAASPGWVAGFEAVCRAPEIPGSPLPASWRAACEEAPGAARDAALVTFPHIAFAIAEYERSQVFTETPWRRYVQGDTAALTANEKRGALLFFQSKAAGGFGCADCHAGDLFSDEAFHAVGAPQIGPGKTPDGEDTGRAAVSGASSERWRFRTPTLLNVEVTGPYFHSGAYGSLKKAVDHYDHQRGRILEYFGVQNKSDTNVRPWCKMSQFKSIPECATLFEANFGGVDAASGLDPLADELHPLIDQRDALLVAFLKTLTDPRVRDAEALAPWVSETSPLAVTPTSDEWHTICDGQIERTADINLRILGLRWMVSGEVADGEDVNAGELYADLFGVRYWELLQTEFMAYSGVQQRASNLAVAVLEALTPPQRTVLYDAWARMEARGHHARWLGLRRELFAAMGRRRAGEAVPDGTFVALLTEAHALERADLVEMARAYQAVAALSGPPGSPDRVTHEATLKALKGGDLASLPAGVVDLERRRLNQGATVRGEAGYRAAIAGVTPWVPFVAGYAVSASAEPCARAFIPRLGDGERRANLFGYGPWVAAYLFDIVTGRPGSGGLQETLSEWIAAEEARVGVSDVFARTLDAVIDGRRTYEAARADLVDGLVTLGGADDPASPEATAALAAIESAQARVAASDAALLLAHLDYYVTLWRAIETSGVDRLTPYVDCLESDATQATRGHGGLGSPTACQPRP